MDAHIDGEHTRLEYSGNGTQVKGYHWGAGLEYTRYTYSSGAWNFLQSVRNGSLGTDKIQEDTIRTDIKSGNVFGTGYG